MKKNGKRFLSMVLALIMVIGLLPVSGFAEEGEIAPASEGSIATTEEEPPVTPSEQSEPEDLNEDPSSAEPSQNDPEAEPAQEAEEMPEAEPVLRATKATDYAFTMQPQCTYDEASDRYIISWATNFVPEKVEIGFVYDDGYFESRLAIGNGYSGMAESMSFPMRPEYMDWRMVVKASPTNSSLDVVQSEQFETGVPFEFKSQPKAVWNASKNAFTVSWETNITPRKAEVGYINSAGQFVAIITNTENLSRSMGHCIAIDQVVPNMYVRLHYGSLMEMQNSNEIEFSTAALKFTSQPSITLYERTDSQGTQGVFHLSWGGVNFTPIKVEIGYKDDSGNWHCEEEIPADQSSLEFEREVDRETTYYVRAYYIYLNRQSYRESEGFTFAPGFTYFHIEHGDPHPLLDEDGIEISWKTNFVPEMVEIDKFNSTEWETLTFLITDMATYMSHTMYYDDFGPKIRIRAWNGPQDYADWEETVYITPRKFTTQPSGGTIDPGGSRTINWKTNFNPTRTRIGYYSGARWVNVKEISDPRLEDSCLLEYEEAHPIMYIRVFFNDSGYIESDPFYINSDALVFSTQPSGGTINPGGTQTISWTTTFTPTKVEIGYVSGNWIPMVTVTSGLNKTMSRSLSYNEAVDGSMYVRAYYNDTDFITSAAFTINKVTYQFTRSPMDITLDPGGTRSISWTTNFTPTKVVIGYENGSGNWTSKVTVTSGLSTAMSRSLGYDDVINGSMYVRAYFSGTEFVTSDAFNVIKADRQFTIQPEGGTVYPWSTLPFTWRTNFVPVKVEIGYRESRTGTWRSVVEITTDLQKLMDYPLSYDEAVNGDMYVRAFYGTASANYVASDPFSVAKRTDYVCGDDLTAALDDDGTLTLTGSGAMYHYDTTDLPPWYDRRGEIKNVVIPDGVTNIGEYAFYNCTNLAEVTIPGSVGSVGRYAFYNCSALSTVIFDGMHSQWEEISVYTGNTRLENAHIVYFYRSGQLGNTHAYWELYGGTDRLEIEGYDGESVHVTAPWQKWGDYIKEIYVEDGFDVIWEGAFIDCPNVKIVRLPGELEKIDYRAFSACKSITDVYFDGPRSDWDKLTIESDNDPLLNATLHTTAVSHELTEDVAWSVDDAGLLRIWVTDEFMGSGEQKYIPHYSSYTATPWVQAGYQDVITAVHVEDGIKTIGGYAFSHLTNLQKVEIADSVTGISQQAFSYCTNLWDVDLPDSITTIAGYTFQHCDMLEDIHLPANATIGAYLFNECRNLEKVWMPTNITSIPNYCFYNCPMLDEIHIPGTLTSVGKYAFSGCTDLTTSYGHVYFDGTSAQWKAITVDEGNAPLQNAGNIHFNPEELRIDAVNFPDANFRGYVSSNIDTDQSGWLTDAEIAAVTSISCGATDIASLQGIAFFTELEVLKCEDNLLTEVDLSANIKLSELDISSNNLISIDLDGLTELRILEVEYNSALTELDLSGVSLQALYCENTGLTSLDLSEQTGLMDLYCYGTGITELDLTCCPILLRAITTGTRTQTTDYVKYIYHISNMRHQLLVNRNCIVYAETSGIRIDEVNFPDPDFRLYVYQYLDTDHRGCLSEEEIEAATYISIDSSENLASVQGIEYFAGLTNLELYGNENLTSVDLSANTKISNLDISDNDLTELDLTGLTELEVLYCNANSISELDVSGNPNLTYIRCNNNSLTSLTLGEQTTLSELYCYNTDLSVLDISGCPLLVDAYKNGTSTATAYGVKYDGPLGGMLHVDANTKVKTEKRAPSNITSSSVDFNGKLYLNTYIKLSDEIMADPDAYVRVTFNGETKDRLVTDLIQTYYDTQGRVKVRLEMFAAMLRDEMTLQVFNGAGEAQPLTYKETTDVTDGFVYTALEYLKGRQEQSTNPYMVELAKAAELYGTAVQVKFDYHTELLTAEDIAAMEAAANAITIPASCAETLTGTLPAGITKRTKTVMFESDNALRQYFYIDGGNIKNYTFTLNGETVKAKKLEAGKYYVQQPNIASALLSTRYSFSVSDGTDTYTIESSALGYAYDRQESSSDPTMVNLSKLLYRYSQAADAYFGQ